MGKEPVINKDFYGVLEVANEAQARPRADRRATRIAVSPAPTRRSASAACAAAERVLWLPSLLCQ